MNCSREILVFTAKIGFPAENRTGLPPGNPLLEHLQLALVLIVMIFGLLSWEMFYTNTTAL